MNILEFKNGDIMPAIGLGTWKSDPKEVIKAVRTAIESGYRHIDCAAVYGNEKEVGQGIKEALENNDIKREDLWITSKLWNSDHKKEDVIPALKQTLKDLGLDYLDLYLMHWPAAFRPDLDGFPENDEDIITKEIPISVTFKQMLEAKKQGLIRHAGVSNFTASKLEKLTDAVEKPEMNQVELHPYLPQKDLVSYCQKNGIHLTGYSPLGSGDRSDDMKADDEPILLENDIIKSIAKKRNASPGQILIKWAEDRGTAVIPKSTNPGRIKENLASADIDFTVEDREAINRINVNYRYVKGDAFTRNGEPSVFSE